jgi:hypothetical protein
MSDALYSLKRQFEKIVEEKNPIMLANRQHDEAKEWNDCYYCHPNSTQAATLVKRIKALEKVDSHLAGLLFPLASRLMLKQAEIMVQKDADLKARNDRKNAAVAKKQDAEATKANPYRKLHPQVAALLKEVAEPYRVKAVEFRTTQENHIVEAVTKLGAMYGSFDPSVMYPTPPRTASHYEHMAISHSRMSVTPYVERTGDYGKYVWAMKADCAKIVAGIANKWADDMVTQFVHKVGTKLSGIVERKGDLHVTAIQGSLQDHWMTFNFKDGSAFKVQSQIVWKTSVNGVHFAQFPTCFRQVSLRGVAMAQPSEAKMRKEFV